MRKMELRIRRSYEATRFAEMYLSDAYERVLPIIMRQIKISKEDRGSKDKKMPMRVEGGIK